MESPQRQSSDPENLTQTPAVSLSEYAISLPRHAMTRYIMKLQYKNNTCSLPDPFTLTSGWSDQPAGWPDLAFGDLYTYLIDTPGQFTHQSLKAHKSLDAYRYVVSGHVQTVLSHEVSADSPYCFLKAKVKPSQRMNDKPHQPWISVHKESGSIYCAHCTCMAGLGEVCSHVAAVLFKVEMGVRTGITTTSCTSRACEWNQDFRKDLLPVPVAESQDTLRGARKKNVQSTSASGQAPLPDLRDLQSLHAISSDSVFFTLIDKVGDGEENDDTDSADEEECCQKFPQTLTSFHEEEASEDIVTRCQQVWKMYHCSAEQAANLEQQTVNQSVCPLWFEHRKGRITGTKVHDVITRRPSTEPDNLVRRIMGYSSYQLSQNAAIKWGIDHESTARDLYQQVQEKEHQGFKCREVGFLISHTMPHLGASADGRVYCSCCGVGVLEIKCPAKHKDHTMEEARELDSNFMIDSDMQLKTNHRYYTQVQMEMHVYGVQYADFVVYTLQTLFIQRILYDEKFCHDAVDKCTSFFMMFVLPELVTRRLEEGTPRPVLNVSADVDVEVWCICREPAYGRMIECANIECAVKWCHYPCVGVQRKPRRKWFCPECSGQR